MGSFSAVLLALGSTIAVSADYSIDPNSVPQATRDQWCTNEKASCPLICLQSTPGTTLVNTCNSTTLEYGCLCGSGLPNVSEYSLTIPYFVCQAWQQQCIINCNGENVCQSNCTLNHLCGAQNPARVNATSTKDGVPGATAAASSGTTLYDGLGSSATLSMSASHAPSTLELGSAYGILVVLASLFTGFALML